MILKRFIREIFTALVPLVAIISLWTVVSLFFNSLIFPSPFETLMRWDSLFTPQFKEHLGMSLARVSVGASLSFTLGIGVAIIARVVGAHSIVEACMALFQVLPGLIIAVVFLLLFGVGSLVPICLIVFMVTPLIAMNTSAALDQKKTEMERLVNFYGGGWWEKACVVYVPQLVPCMRANALLATTMAVKICLLGEFIGAENGLGYLINISRMYFDMEAVFFYIAIILLLIFGFQLALRVFFHLFLQKYFY